VAFGLSMAFDFDYYLIDEVMSVGDAQFKRKCAKVFKEKTAAFQCCAGFALDARNQEAL